MPFIAQMREGRSTVEEEQPMASGVLQCFRYGEKRGRGSACFESEKENVGCLLVPTRRRNQRCGGG
jgi:hypothetical protein